MLIFDTDLNLTPYLSRIPKGSVAIRYINPIGTGTAKTIHPAEAHALAAAGIQVMCVCEGYGDITHGSINSAAGARDELVCVSYAKQIGMPLENVTLAFAIDQDLNNAQISAYAIPYFRSIHAKMPPGVSVMVYGPGAAIRAVIAAGYAKFGWAPGARGWNGTRAYVAGGTWTLAQSLPSKPLGFDLDLNQFNPAHGPLGSFLPFAHAPAIPSLAPLVFPSDDVAPVVAKASLWTDLKKAAATIGL